MSTPVLDGAAVVGKFYMVPCMKTLPNARSIWISADGWVPVMGPKHSDAEHLGFKVEHFHIDWRFVAQPQYRYAISGKSGSPLGRVLTNTHGDGWDPRIEGEPQLRRIKCKRPMPDFPPIEAVSHEQQETIKWKRMERAQAFACNKLKPGNICPHRGIDLTPFIKDDGTVICPGHGLRWDTNTGNLLPHHARSA